MYAEARYLAHMVEGKLDNRTDTAVVAVRGRARRVAVALTVVLVLAALWAAKLDYDSVYERNSVPLDVLSALYKALSIAGLIVVGRRLKSRSIYIIAALVAALAVGSLFVNSSLSDTLINPIATLISDNLPVSHGFAHFGIIFCSLAAIAGAMVFVAYTGARSWERSTVLILIGILFLEGVFVGPVNAISTQGFTREWLFAEDFGQVISLAILTGYTSGLIVATFLILQILISLEMIFQRLKGSGMKLPVVS